jgi:hypothetical protein
VELSGVAMHALPMALESEEDSIGHSQGAEHAPAIQQTHLTGAQAFFVRVENVVVVQQEAVHISMLSRIERMDEMVG